MFWAVGLVNGPGGQAPESIMQGDIECRIADQGGQPGHRFSIRNPAVLVEIAQDSWKELLLKVVSHFKGVAALLERKPSRSEFMAETLQSLVAFLIGQRTRPDPLHTQRGLAPAFDLASHGIGDAQSHARASDGGQGLVTEFKRDSRTDREGSKDGPEQCGESFEWLLDSIRQRFAFGLRRQPNKAQPEGIDRVMVAPARA